MCAFSFECEEFFSYAVFTQLIFLNDFFGTWMKQTFEEADKNGDGLLNIDEIYQLLHKLNVNLPRRKVKQMFQVTFYYNCIIFLIYTHKNNSGPSWLLVSGVAFFPRLSHNLLPGDTWDRPLLPTQCNPEQNEVDVEDG